MKILKSYKKMMMEFVNEVDDDKIIKYKTKDGEQGEMKAGSAKSMPTDHPAKMAWDKMQDGGDGEEKPKGQAMGGGDFDRDSNRAGDDDADDMDRDARFAADDDEEKSAESENEKIIGSLEDMDLDGLNVDSLDSAIDSGQYASITGKDDDPDNEMSVNAFTGEDGKVEYGINVGVGHKMIYFDSKEEALEAAQKLFKDDKIRKAMDGEGDETLADLGDHANSIVKGKDETVTINGKQYKPIKESKQHILKENYDRFFGEK